MRDQFPFFRSFTIPTGAGPNDSRIVLNGVTGQIEVYDTGVLVGVWSSTAFIIGNGPPGSGSVTIRPNVGGRAVIHLDPETTGIDDPTPAEISAVIQGGDDTPFLLISSPAYSGIGETPARIDLYSSNAVGIAQVPHIELAPNAGGGSDGYVNIPDNGSNVDFRIDNRSVGRGLLTGFDFTDIASSPAYAASGVTDAVINNFPHIAGRTYYFHNHARWNLNAVGRWDLQARINGVKVGEFDWVQSLAGALGGVTDAYVKWTAPTTGTSNLDLFLNEQAGASTITFIAGADNERWLTIEDKGVL